MQAAPCRTPQSRGPADHLRNVRPVRQIGDMTWACEDSTSKLKRHNNIAAALLQGRRIHKGPFATVSHVVSALVSHADGQLTKRAHR